MYKLVPDVQEFLNKCSSMVGEFEHNTFNRKIFCLFFDTPIESPIEQILYCSFYALVKVHCWNLAYRETVNGKNYLVGIGLTPQMKIGKYRVDFLASYGQFHWKTGEYILKEVIIECDSQEFHERTEQERRYEKERDRFLQSKDYKVFHFTGKEIKDQPFRMSGEVLSFLTGKNVNGIAYSDFILQ
jgi:very-short-patch-repair endonuclease